jgi:hypothetical protein
LSDEDCELVLCICNHPWSECDAVKDPTASVVHWCTVGCCVDIFDTQQKLRKVLWLLFGSFPAVPLLYRWKNFDPCAVWTLRGIAVNNFLIVLMRICSDDVEEQGHLDMLDEDDPDQSFAVKQNIRIHKTMKMVCRPETPAAFSAIGYPLFSQITPKKHGHFVLLGLFVFFSFVKQPTKANICKALFIGKPFSAFIDHVALVETARQRLLLRAKGVRLPLSKCPATEEHIRSMNLALFSGKRALEITRDYTDILESPPSADHWLPWLGEEGKLSIGGCFLQILSAMCESYRRLYLPYQAFPWKLFQIVEQSVEQTVVTLAEAKHCPGCCSDAPFTQVLC